jgi:hypothetical protein
MYQRNVVRVAAPRRDAGSGRLLARLRTAARQLYFSAVGVDAADRQFLQDFARDEERYQLVALQRLVAIARCSVKPEDREAIAEIIRGELLDGVPAVQDVQFAGELEMKAQAEHDLAWRAFELSPCRAHRDRAIETGTLHLHGIRAQLDAAHAAAL